MSITPFRSFKDEKPFFVIRDNLRCKLIRQGRKITVTRLVISLNCIVCDKRFKHSLSFIPCLCKPCLKLDRIQKCKEKFEEEEEEISDESGITECYS